MINQLQQALHQIESLSPSEQDTIAREIFEAIERQNNSMRRPAEIDLPFFAYGVFRPGQLAFFQVREFVSKIVDPVQISGTLLLRDGLPIIDQNGRNLVQGALLWFAPGHSGEAYD